MATNLSLKEVFVCLVCVDGRSTKSITSPWLTQWQITSPPIVSSLLLAKRLSLYVHCLISSFVLWQRLFLMSSCAVFQNEAHFWAQSSWWLRGCCSQILPLGGAWHNDMRFFVPFLFGAVSAVSTPWLGNHRTKMISQSCHCSCVAVESWAVTFPRHFCLLSHCLFISWFFLSGFLIFILSLCFHVPKGPEISMCYFSFKPCFLFPSQHKHSVKEKQKGIE